MGMALPVLVVVVGVLVAEACLGASLSLPSLPVSSDLPSPLSADLFMPQRSELLGPAFTTVPLRLALS
jgi:hypothetical protein